MPQVNKKYFLILTTLSIFQVQFMHAQETKSMYVQAIRADLRREPGMNSEKVGTLKRGEEVTLREENGLWLHVKSSQGVGWICKLFTSPHKPVGQAELVRDVPMNLEKVSRRRSNSYAVSAATRGLMTSERSREGREMYQSDFEALEKMEQYSIKMNNLDNFRKSARFPEE